MKLDTVPVLVQIERKQLQKLCTQVKETIATDAGVNAKKSNFGVADLWNARRGMYTAAKRWNSRQQILSRL